MRSSLLAALKITLLICGVAGSPSAFKVVLRGPKLSREFQSDVCASSLVVRVPKLYTSVEIQYDLNNAWHALIVSQHSRETLQASQKQVELDAALFPAARKDEEKMSIYFSLDSTQTCSDQCAQGFRRVGKSKPYTCLECAPPGLSRKDLCGLGFISPSNSLCNKNTAVFGDMFFLDCQRHAESYADSLTRCSEEHSGHQWYMGWDEPFPQDRASCERTRTCPYGFYRELRTASRCIACTDRGAYGMRGVPKAVARPMQNITLQDSCDCQPGHFFDSGNQMCRLCSVGTYRAERGLYSACDSCASCKARYQAGNTECVQGCASGRDMYWSRSTQKCKVCPTDLEIYLQSSDFAADLPLAATDVFINVSRCANKTLSSNCLPPEHFLQARRTCVAGHELVRGSDTEDNFCRPCLDGFYSSDGVLCVAKVGCSGSNFSREGILDKTQDMVCSHENLEETWSVVNWSYPFSAGHQQVAYGDERNFSLLNVATTTCKLNASAEDKKYHLNTLYQSWQSGAQHLLPFIEPPACIFSCKPGSMRTNESVPACRVCNPGFFSDLVDANICLQCPPGTFSNKSGSVSCDLCPSGTYSSEYGATECAKCCELGQDTCTYPEGGALKSESASGSYLTSACNPGSTIHNLRSCASVALDCQNCNVIPDLVWKEYGPGHCLAPAECQEVAHAQGWETKSECKPYCLGGRYAAYNNGSWSCEMCDFDATRCPAGHFMPESCNSNRNTQCEPCELFLTPYSRLQSVDSTVRGSTACQTVCRSQSQELGVWFLSAQKAADIVHVAVENVTAAIAPLLTSDRTVGLCIPSTVPTDMCSGPEDDIMIPVLLTDTNNTFLNLAGATANDAAYPTWPLLTCQRASTMQEFRIGQLFQQVLTTGSSNSRRLLQAPVIEVLCAENMYMHESGQCIPCPFGTMSTRGAKKESDCFCMPGYFRNDNASSLFCHQCPVGAALYCPGGYQSDRPPSNIVQRLRGVHVFSCDEGTAQIENTTQCVCPGNTSNEFSFARSILDCIPNAGFKMNQEQMKEGVFQVERCAKTTEQLFLTRYIKSSTRGRIVLSECVTECDAALGARSAAAPDNTCECDPTRNLAWNSATNACECKVGFSWDENAERACLPCPQNHYCTENRQRRCPAGTISPPLSHVLTNCSCDVGMFRLFPTQDDMSCVRCNIGSYCPDGLSPKSCVIQTVQDGTEMFCEDTGLSFPGRCPAGLIRSQDTCLVTDPRQLQFQNDNTPLLCVNLARYVNNEPVNFSPRVDSDLIPGLASIDWLSAAVSYKAIPEVGVMAGAYDIFCNAGTRDHVNRSIVVISADSPQFARGTLKCADEQSLKRRLLYSSMSRVRTYNIGTDSFIDESVARWYVQGEPSELPGLNLAVPESHLTWGVLLHCENEEAYSRWHSSEIQICATQCPTMQRQLQFQMSLKTSFASELSALTHTEVIWLDVPSQVGWLKTFYPVPPLDTQVAMVIRQTNRGDGSHSVQVEIIAGTGPQPQTGIFNMPTVPLSGQTMGRIAFAVSMPRWRYLAPFQPSLLMGVCTDSQEFRLILYRVLSAEVFDVHFDCGGLLCYNVPQVCHDEDGYGSLSALVHSDHLYFVNKARPGDGIFFVPLRKIKPTRMISSAKNFLKSSSTSNSEPILPGSGNVLDVAWYASCIASDSEDRRYCPVDFFAIQNDVFYHVYPEVQHPADPQNVDFSEVRDKYQHRAVFSKSKLCAVLGVGGECEHSMRRFAVLSPAQTDGYDDAYGAKPDVFFDVLVAMEPKIEDYLREGARARAVRLVHVHFNATFTEFSVLPSIFLRRPISSLQYTLRPVAETDHKNLVLAKGTVMFIFDSADDSGQITIDLFDIACSGCIEENAVLDPSDGSCRCSPGSAPVALPCYDHCSSHRFSMNETETRRDFFMPVFSDTPNGFIHQCVACTGNVFCVDGTKSGVLECPNATFSLAEKSSERRDCVCDSGSRLGLVEARPTRSVFPELLQIIQDSAAGCTPCSDGILCNAFTNSADNILRCGPGSSLVLDSRKKETKLEDSYECVCDNGTFVQSSFTQTHEHAFPQTLSENEWMPGSILQQFSGNSAKKVTLTIVSCAACPPGSFCKNGLKNPCPEGATSAVNSSSRSDCKCPLGSVLDEAAGRCKQCQVSFDFICVHGKNVSCSGQDTDSRLCPCPSVDGKAMITVAHDIGSVCKTVCPENHYCPPMLQAHDVHSQNTPRRCPGNRISKAGSSSIEQCSCPQGEYARSDNDEFCFPCLRDHFCVDSKLFPCPEGHSSIAGQSSEASCQCTEPNFCACEQGMKRSALNTCELHPGHPHLSWAADGLTEECGCGFAARDAAFEMLSSIKQITRQLDHPFSPDFRVALAQYEQNVQLNGSATCVLCPPGAVCKEGNRARISLSSPGLFYNFLPMGSFADEVVMSCPSHQQPDKQLNQLTPVGLSSCFWDALSWSSSGDQIFQATLSSRPSGMILFEGKATENYLALWNSLVLNQGGSWSAPLFADVNWPAFTRTIDSNTGMALIRIDLPRVITSFLEHVATLALRKRLMQKLVEIDQGSGIASEILTQTAWAILVSNSNYFSNTTLEGIVVVSGVVKTVISSSIAARCVDTITDFFSGKYSRLKNLQSPRIVFTTHFREINSQDIYSTAIYKHNNMHYVFSGLCSEKIVTGSCLSTFTDSVLMKSYSLQYSRQNSVVFDYDAFNKENSLHAQVKLSKTLALSVQKKCPFSTIPQQEKNTITCASCAKDNYQNLFFDTDTKSCAECSVVSAADCLIRAADLSPHACSFANNMHCA